MRGVGCLLLLIATGVAIWWFGSRFVRDHPQDVPWTKLSLTQPIGRFTGRKVAGLSEDTALCRSLLEQAGSRAVSASSRRDGPQCGYDDGMRLAEPDLVYDPAGPVTSCPVAAGLFILERQVIQPAARRRFGTEVARVVHAGSYSCRRLYNRSEGAFSEHATADAFDVLGFVLDDGRRISVLKDWSTPGDKAAFLRDVRDGACSLFATVLSPDYNRAHADHLHLDQAQRGAGGWRACR
ncbi:extensin family protein [Sphingomonas piscis]|uniref:Extensin family protein n=1 Tax=Sphingomonas piscis TaxID=2714943 RepID=A0A6G7YMF1_9SPHN|nr:extensin family protein [Sphingomonas piscis]QIK77925.1 extensin family protein [Sphingomonas piscis]